VADRTVAYRIVADIGNLRAQMAQGSASVRKFGDDVTKVGKEGEKFRKGFDTAGRTAGRFGLIAAAGLGVMVAKAATFEQAMSNVAAATHESEANMGLLRDAAIDAGASTAFSASEAAAAIENLAKAGVATADILGENGALNGSLALAAAGQLEVADAAEFTATALTQFQLAGSEATHVADILAAGAGKAQGEVSDMANALKYAGVPAANLGISIEQTAGALALFAKNGIIGEQAGTSMRGMLSSLTSPSKVAAETMSDLGISLFDAQGEFIGLAGVADQLQTQLGGLTEQERSAALGRIFGNEQLQAANVLYREGAAGVEEWTKNVDDAGFAAETAAIKTDNLRGDIERLGGALDTALISGGSGSQGALRGLTQGLTGLVDGYNKLPPAASNAASGLLAAGAVAGGTIWAGSKLVRTVSDTREALANLGPAGQKGAKGLGLVTKAVGALAVGLVAYQIAKDQFDIGIDDDDVRRQTELIAAKYGPDIQAQIEATTAAIKEQQKVTGEGFSLNIGVAKLFSDQDASDAFNRINGLNDSLAELRHQQELADIASGNFAATLPILGGAVRDLGAKQVELNAANDGAVSGFTRAGNAVTYTAEQMKEARDALDDMRKQAAEVGASFFGLGEKVDKAKVSLGQWITDLERQTKALQEFAANAEKAGKRGLDEGLIQSLENLGPSGALRLGQLANATDKEIGRANKAWKRGQKAIDAYVAATVKIPKPLRIEADTQQANNALDALRRKLNNLRSVQMDVRLGGTPTYATGGPVRGPGSATSDSIPAYLSNGEYVIKAAAVARYGTAMFDRLNSMHFAQGGQVGSGSGGGVGIDYAQLAAVMANAAPFIGNATFNSQNDYERAKRDHSRKAGLGGRGT
jgi:TP901 family phage tail tape measure protein